MIKTLQTDINKSAGGESSHLQIIYKEVNFDQGKRERTAKKCIIEPARTKTCHNA